MTFKTVSAGVIAGLTLLCGGEAAVAQGNGMIEVVVNGIRNAHGYVYVEICPQGRFLKDCAYKGEVPAQTGSVTIIIRDVVPGRYAAQGDHDENGNHKLDRGLFGIPKEGFAFSRDARVCMGPPRFRDAAFDYAGGHQRIALTMKYKIC